MRELKTNAVATLQPQPFQQLVDELSSSRAHFPGQQARNPLRLWMP